MAHPVGESLHKGVCEYQAEGGRPQQNAVAVELQQNAQPQQQLTPQQPCASPPFAATGHDEHEYEHVGKYTNCA